MFKTEFLASIGGPWSNPCIAKIMAWRAKTASSPGASTGTTQSK